MADSIRRGQPQAPAAKWLVDNYPFIDEQIAQVRRLFPPEYSRQLPRLGAGASRGLPRIYELALDLVAHTDGRVDDENLALFIRAYQAVCPLTLGELWAVPIMANLALVESLRRVSRRIAWRRRHRASAVEWSQRFITAVQVDPKSLITTLADFVRCEPGRSAPFLAELTACLQGTHPAMGLVINWVEQELSERGQTLELIQQAESHDQAVDHASISHSITSLRQLGRLDWRTFVESLSVTEAILRQDPVGLHAQMDFHSRNLCRGEIEDLARRSGWTEPAVASAAVRLAASGAGRGPADPHDGTVAYYLVDQGRAVLEAEIRYRPGLRRRVERHVRAWALPLYLASIAALTAALTATVLVLAGDGLHALEQAAVLLALLLPASRSAVSIVNWAASLLIAPRPLLRLDFEQGLPPEHRTAVIVPAILSSADTVDALLEHLERRFLSNRDPNVLLVLLTDFPDASAEDLPGDGALLDRAIVQVRALNDHYARGGPTAFYLLHRPRQWNAHQRLWMGHERKRGKIEHFNRLVLTGATEPFVRIEGDLAHLRGARYAIVLDADTQLPPQAAWRMAAAMGHPLNRPQVDAARRCVTRGYGILQPRLAIALPQSQRTRFASLFAGEVGLDPYTREVSNVYQDLFGQTPFVGKAIYDIRAFDTTVSARFPNNRILSHDLIEGCHARCGFLADVELLEDHPESYLADASRRRRWARGDWQIARWLRSRVPGPDGTRRLNPLDLLARWMILDNLRRSLVPAGLLAAMLLGWALAPPFALGWTAALLALVLLPDVLRSARALVAKPPHLHWSIFLPVAARREARQWALSLIDLLLIPFHAAMYLTEIVRTQWRLGRDRRLLEWQTASDAARRSGTSPAGVFLAMWPAPLLCAVTAVATLWGPGWRAASVPPASRWAVGVLLIAWCSAPAVMWWLGRPRPSGRQSLDERQRRFLRRAARRTWEYFARFVGPAHHGLPPDNVQHDPPIGEAPRTSPTNIGMSLLGALAAWDFGYVSAGTVLARTRSTVQTLDRLQRHRGHFLNWYDTRTLEPAPPRYVSTADSGNLAGALVTLQAGLAELGDQPLLPPAWREGLEDVVGLALEELDQPECADLAGAERMRRSLIQQVAAVRGAGPGPTDAWTVLSALATTAAQAQALPPRDSELAYWLEAVRTQCDDLRTDLETLAPWLRAASGESCSNRHPLFAGTLPALRAWAGDEAPAPAREQATLRLADIAELADRCGELADMDLGFLYDQGRKLLANGYNVDAQQRDPGYYDLLASEARLCSFLGIGRGQLPQEHWFHLGRQLAPGSRAVVLISWSGSMFEYLMPLLLMPSYDATLLDQSCREAVALQRRLGHRRSIPWGVSESCYNQLDAQKAYQYRAFGVPGLGLKAGLADDLVVAPYAAALALMVDAPAACANLETMAARGFLGRYGFYEAADFTPARLAPGQDVALVRSHMAHHSGMGLLAFDHALRGAPMHRRFLADPRHRAALLLLQERIPLAEAGTRTALARFEPDLRHAGEPPEAAQRTFTSADTPSPEVHLLSNGRYHVMITAAGSGASRWRDLALTRWQEDATRDHWGTYLYVRDVDSGAVWSATAQPTGGVFERYECQFTQGLAEFRTLRNDLQTHLRVAVSSEEDVELRRLTVTNLSDRPRHLEVTTYAEVALLNGPNASEQPAFNGLFIAVEAVPAKAALLCTRRTRSPDENWPLFFHAVRVHHQPVPAELTWAAERSQFLGRGHTAADPGAVCGAWPGATGIALDPVMAIRRTLRLAPAESLTLDAVWGVAPDRSAAVALLDRFADPHLAARVFELARMDSQILLHELQATEANAQLFGRMACFLAYAGPRLRARASLIARNHKGQSALWAYGISGDIPIVLLRIFDLAALDLVRQLIQAHAYWRHKGLHVDLVILSEAYAGYRHSLVDAVIGLINVGPETKALDQPAGIFVRTVSQGPEDDALVLPAVSRIVLSDRAGTLAEQLDRQVVPEWEALPLRPTRRPERDPLDTVPAPTDLLFFNGWGGFTPDGREYVVVLEPGVSTPAPWVNVLANPRFGSVVSESGAAYTWFENAHEFRLTPWYNDAVTDVSGEAVYLRDEDSGVYWSPMPGPARGRTRYISRHGLGYSAFDHCEEGLATEVLTYVAPDAPLKFVAITVRNQSGRDRRISLTGYVEWVLGESRQRNAMHVVTRLDAQSGAIFATNAYGQDFPDAVAFLHCSYPRRTITSRRTEFLGRNGSPATPAALARQELSNRVGGGVDPCAAIQAYVDLPADDQVRIVFVLGAAENEHHARSLIAQHGTVDGARHVLDNVWEFWKRSLGGVYAETPDPSVNLLVNHWLLYQTLACRLWGRSGFYQSGGAFGFRDQLQDALALLYECPWITRQHLLLCASRQFQNGDVQHWWHPPAGRGVRTRIADDYLWLPHAVCRYVQVTGDTGILEEQVAFLEAPPLEPGQESRFGLPRVSDRRASLWDHCVRAVDRGLHFGVHGLPLMGSGDWNDGMNRVGHRGQGESVWLGFFLHDVLTAIAALAVQRGDQALADRYRGEARGLAERIEAHAWDGAWYRRAFFDDGQPLGSAQNPQCQVDLLPQAWAVLSGAADPARARQALATALQRLVDPGAGIIRLFDPPFDGPALDPGYVRGYAPGVRENGGQYTHAALWAVMAVARLGQAQEAWRLFGLLNPIHHADTATRAARYKVEPYVLAADVYSVAGHEGRGGWTWYTGAAGWMYRLLVEDLLGLRLHVDTLTFAPLLPADWGGYTLHYRYRNTYYHIHVTRVSATAARVQRVLLDGVEQHDLSLHLVDDGQERHAIVEVGDPPTVATPVPPGGPGP